MNGDGAGLPGLLREMLWATGVGGPFLWALSPTVPSACSGNGTEGTGAELEPAEGIP